MTGSELTSFLLTEQVEVYRAVVTKQTIAGLKVEFILHGRMYRLDFYVRYLIWLAAHVLGLDQKFGFDDAISSNLLGDAMRLLDKVDNRIVLDRLKQFLFRNKHEPNSIIAYYAKDGKLGDSILSKKLMFTAASQCDKLRDIVRQDILPHIGTYDGMSMQKAWVYNGGTTVAGHHVEDGFLKFVHACYDIQWDRLDIDWQQCIQPTDHNPVSGKMALQVLQTVNRLALKSWLVGSNAATAAGILHINKTILEAFDEMVTDYESALWSRVYVLDPAYFTAKHPTQFKEILLMPGEALLSNHSHSVVGFCGVCVAWNVLLLRDLADCIELEHDMAICMRNAAHSGHLRHSNGRGTVVYISIANELMRKIDVMKDKASDTSRVCLAQDTDLNKKVNSLVLQPSASYLYDLYIKDHRHSPWLTSTYQVGQSRDSVVCSGIVSHRQLGLVSDPTTKRHLDTRTIVCYLCGIPCLIDAIMVSVKQRRANKKATTSRMLCHDCFSYCRGDKDLIANAEIFTVRSSYQVFEREYQSG